MSQTQTYLYKNFIIRVRPTAFTFIEGKEGSEAVPNRWEYRIDRDAFRRSVAYQDVYSDPILAYKAAKQWINRNWL